MKELLCKLKEEEKIIISSIYDFRCLNIEQIIQLLNYNIERLMFIPTEEKTLEVVKELIDKNVIEEIVYKNNKIAYFLTGLGIKLYVNTEEVAVDILDLDKNKIKKGYNTAGQLKINPIYINHQIHTNQFVIDFQLNIDGNLNYTIINEKDFAYLNSILRPDGVIRIGNYDLYIETDMGTESSKQLEEKWENYRSFLNSNNFLYNERKIIVLFICNGVKQVDKRINLVKRTIYNAIIDKITDNFEVIVGSHDGLIRCCCETIIPSIQNGMITFDKLNEIIYNKHHLSSVRGEKVKNYLCDTNYLAYSRIIDENNKVLTLNNRLQLYLFDDYTHGHLSIIHNLCFFERNEVRFRNQTTKKISLIVIVKSIEDIYNDLKVFNIYKLKNIYFTTYERLRNKTFYNALFTIDEFGNVFTFTNYGLEETIFEKKI